MYIAKMPIRIRLQDRFLVSARGVRHLGKGLYKNRIVDFNMNANPHVICPEVQTWLIDNVGHHMFAEHHYDRYYYPGDNEPTHENILAVPKLPNDARRWKRIIDKTGHGRFERFIKFKDEDADWAFDFMLRYGESFERF